jgi:hypothetical protein
MDDLTGNLREGRQGWQSFVEFGKPYQIPD